MDKEQNISTTEGFSPFDGETLRFSPNERPSTVPVSIFNSLIESAKSNPARIPSLLGIIDRMPTGDTNINQKVRELFLSVIGTQEL